MPAKSDRRQTRRYAPGGFSFFFLSSSSFAEGPVSVAVSEEVAPASPLPAEVCAGARARRAGGVCGCGAGGFGFAPHDSVPAGWLPDEQVRGGYSGGPQADGWAPALPADDLTRWRSGPIRLRCRRTIRLRWSGGAVIRRLRCWRTVRFRGRGRTIRLRCGRTIRLRWSGGAVVRRLRCWRTVRFRWRSGPIRLRCWRTVRLCWSGGALILRWLIGRTVGWLVNGRRGWLSRPACVGWLPGCPVVGVAGLPGGACLTIGCAAAVPVGRKLCISRGATGCPGVRCQCLLLFCKRHGRRRRRLFCDHLPIHYCGGRGGNMTRR